jgi:hypothetical protein
MLVTHLSSGNQSLIKEKKNDGRRMEKNGNLLEGGDASYPSIKKEINHSSRKK